MSRSWARLLAIVVSCGVLLIPLIAMVLGSLRAPGLAPAKGLELLPEPLSWSNYSLALSLVPLGTFIRNSLLVVVIAVPVTVLVASWAGFAIATAKPRIQRRLVVLSLIALMIPIVSLWIPRFALFKTLGMIDTLWPLIAPSLMATSPFFVLLFAMVYSRIPGSLYEAARLEGLSPLAIWRRVAFPLGRPATFAVAMLAFVFHWSNFTDALLYLHSQENFTAPLGTRALQGLEPALQSIFLAGAVMVTIPAVVAFLISQRAFFARVLDVR